ncbi:molybdenum cofactor guanylyltransferase [Erythrobacter sp. AP23]|uniref:molybdenum cofactor guanylyltransferase n=1 Tax=Erythrobacter sp. AP23 TaxID=499656 RepID=UPI00076CFB54|nr:molybdenum cofactor guanylyltransferase [Erythrobacter sp. AP23]KWV94639.1 hypothetical protein ASS64_08640 [Erythrobacter sp. AP23]
MATLRPPDLAKADRATACVVIAGGEGRRMGGNKPFRLFAGKTLLARALRQAASFSNLVAVAMRDTLDLGDIPVILDPPDMAGPLAGLATGLDFARRGEREWLLTIPCDMPFLPADLLVKLANALDGQAVALAASGWRTHPVCALWHTSACEALPGFCERSDRSLHGFAEHVGFATARWGNAPDPFFNVNCSEDLAAAARMLMQRRVREKWVA